MDIVIPVKAAYLNEELRYALRSICKNFPHDKIWIVGYRPPWLEGNIHFLPGNNAVGSKYEKVLSNHLATMKHSEISEDFYLFNDDFFVLKPVTDFKNYHRGTIAESVEWRESLGGPSFYLNSLKSTREILRRMGFLEPLDYGLHIPMIINKKRWLRAYQAQLKFNPEKKVVHMRTIYGNLFLNSGGIEKMNDVKITTMEDEPPEDWTFVSTVDSSFVAGKVGKYVQKMFPEMCQCEGVRPNTFMLQ